MNGLKTLGLKERLALIENNKGNYMVCELVKILNMSVGDYFRWDDNMDAMRVLSGYSIYKPTPIVDLFYVYIKQFNEREEVGTLANALVSPLINSGDILNAFRFSWQDFVFYLVENLPDEYDFKDKEGFLMANRELNKEPVSKIFKLIRELYDESGNERYEVCMEKLLYVMSMGLFLFNNVCRENKIQGGAFL